MANDKGRGGTDNKDREDFFKSIAAAYIEKEGARLLDELDDSKIADTPYPARLDRRVNGEIARLKLMKAAYRIMPFAACLIIYAAIRVYLPFAEPEQYGDNAAAPGQLAEDSAPHDTDRPMLIPLSGTLPNGYNVTEVDYDKTKTIYRIVNAENNNIVITAEPYEGIMETEQFDETMINSQTAYMCVRRDYSVLKYEKDNTLYTLTSRYNYKDLMELGKAFI